MKSIIVYGSTTGNTEAVSAKIADKLGAEAFAVADCPPEKLGEFELIILGVSTWGAGDLQDDWEEALTTLKEVDFTGKKVALFGLGDQDGYPDTFVDGMGTLYDMVTKKGAQVVGMTSAKGYDFTNSTALRDGRFVGLVLDEDNQAELSDERIGAWIHEISG